MARREELLISRSRTLRSRRALAASVLSCSILLSGGATREGLWGRGWGFWEGIEGLRGTLFDVAVEERCLFWFSTRAPGLAVVEADDGGITIGLTPGAELLFRFDLESIELTLLALACRT